MMRIEAIEATERLAPLKRQYMQHTTAPLDGMWLCGFVPLASHFGVSLDDELAGYFCVNSDGYLLQFFVRPVRQRRASQVFEAALEGRGSANGEIAGAFASTAEPLYLSLCLDHFSRFEVNALMYQLDDARASGAPGDDPGLIALVPAQLADAVEFAVASIGASPKWLEGYYGRLIDRGELFGVWDEGRLLATGESRGYDVYQTAYADVGVIVAESERGRGLATRILAQLVAMNESKGLASICSTEKRNVAAQKAITRAGFSARNRIVRFDR